MRGGLMRHCGGSSDVEFLFMGGCEREILCYRNSSLSRSQGWKTRWTLGKRVRYDICQVCGLEQMDGKRS